MANGGLIRPWIESEKRGRLPKAWGNATNTQIIQIGSFVHEFIYVSMCEIDSLSINQ